MRRKSQEQKGIQGTDRSDRRGSSVKKFEGKIPRPVIKLSPVAKKWYKNICQELIDVDGFISPDSLVVAQFCKALDLYIKISEKLNGAKDCVQEYKNGSSNISGDFVAFSKLSTMLKELAPQVGVGIQSRKNVAHFINNQLTLQFGDDPFMSEGKIIQI